MREGDGEMGRRGDGEMGRRGEVMLGCWDCSFPRHQERCGAQERGSDHIGESGAGLDLIGVCELPIGIQTFENLIREDFVGWFILVEKLVDTFGMVHFAGKTG